MHKKVIEIKILALDQASKKTGWSVFEENKLQDYGLIDLSKEGSPSKRFEDMCKAVQKLIVEQSPDYVVFEEVAMQTNAYSLILLARLQGVIQSVCYDRKIEFYIYPPSAWRKVLCFQQGRGYSRKDLKKQAIQYCKDCYGFELDEDRADAICIGTAFVNKFIRGV